MGDAVGPAGLDWFPLSFFAKEHGVTTEAIRQRAKAAGLRLNRNFPRRAIHLRLADWQHLLEHGCAPDPEPQTLRRKALNT